MSRSLQVDRQSTESVKASLRRCGFRSQRSLAEDLNLALSTVSRFLNGKPVDFATFVEICDRLNLDWRTITDSAKHAITDSDLAPSSPPAPQTVAMPPENIPAPAPVPDVESDASWQDWGEAIDTTFFHGRQDELAQLQTAIGTDQCRLVALLGIGGIGKTSLAAKLASTIQTDFEAVIWRSVRNAPPLKTLLQDLVPFLSQQQDIEPTVERLFHWLRTHRCLVILDNVETLLASGQSGQYRAGYEDYGTLLRQFSETTHRSCLIVTSREKPSEIGLLESDQLLTRSFQLGGSAEAAQAIVAVKGLQGNQKTIAQFCQRYGDNPLAIKIVGTSIQAIFDGDINLFLQENAPIFNDFRRLLNQQFERLSPLEQSILYWLAINREWTTISELLEDIWPTVSRADVFEALESLRWRSLIETRSGQYTQQPVIMEYVTDRLIQTVCQDLEVLSQQSSSGLLFPDASCLLFCTHALIKTTTKDYVHASQHRMILEPVAECLQTTLVQPHRVRQYMGSVLQALRQVVMGYGVGNFINLCRKLNIDFAAYDFSNLTIWQADLLAVNLQGTNFAGANFCSCRFNQQFGAVTALALNSDNTLLAAGDIQGNIHIWQTETYQHLATLNDHTDGVFAVAFAPDGRYLLSGSSDTTLKLWRIADYQCVTTFVGHSQIVMTVAFSPDGKWVASGGLEHTLKLWDVASGRCLRNLEGHTNAIRSLAFASTGNCLASASFDQTIKLWDWPQGNCIASLEGHTQGVWSVQFSSDNRFLVSGSNDHTIRIWDPQTGDCLKILSGHHQAVWFVTVSPDSQSIASGDYSGLIKLWNIESGLCQRTFGGHSDWLWSIVFAKDGNRLYSGSQDRTIRIWDTQNGYCLRTLSGYTNTVWSLAFSKNGQYLASGSHNGDVRLWDITYKKCVEVIPHNHPIFDISFSADGKYLASGSGGDKASVKVWRLDNRTLQRDFSGHPNIIRSIAFHPQKNILAIASADQIIKLWDIDNGKCTGTLIGHSNIVWSVVFSHSGTYLATGSYDCSVKLWNLETGACLRTLKAHSDHIFSVAFSPDDTLLASTSSDTTVKFWSMQTGQCLQTLIGHSNAVLAGLFSPDGTLFVSSEFNGNIKVWDVVSGACRHTIQAHKHIPWALAFSPDGEVLASGSEANELKLWDMRSWQCMDTLKLPGPYEGMDLTEATGLSDAQKNALYALGAISA